MNAMFGVLLMGLGTVFAGIGCLTLFFFPSVGLPCLLGGLLILGVGAILERIDRAAGALGGLAELLSLLRALLDRDRL